MLEQAVRVAKLRVARASLVLRNLVKFRRTENWPLPLTIDSSAWAAAVAFLAVAAQLGACTGVMDWVISVPEQLVYVKANKREITENELRNALERGTLSV